MPPRKESGCWTNRSRLELSLMGVIFVATIIVVLLLFFIVRKSPQAKPIQIPPDVCHTRACIQQAGKMIRRIDPNVDPCEDFYQFACGNFLKASHGDEKLNEFYLIHAQQKRELSEIYSEDVEEGDHEIVESAKNLFRECMNVAKIESDGLKSIKRVLEEIGGWPVSRQGADWKEERFDWLRATYKLRERGYPFGVFLNLDIEEYGSYADNNLLKVAAPEVTHSMLNKYSKERAVEIMTEVAMQFGSNDRRFAFKQMDGTYRFWEYLKNLDIHTNMRLIKIVKYQHEYGDTFNWLEFLNNMTGPAVDVGEQDLVIIQNEEGLRKWLELITTTPKRTLANYMIWTVIENLFPYLPKSIRNLDTIPEKPEISGVFDSMFQTLEKSRLQFCMKEAEKRFDPNPIEILHNRKYLPVERKKRIEEILLNIKSEFANIIQNADLVEEKDKDIVLARLTDLVLVVGQPQSYSDDEIFGTLNVDIVPVPAYTFLNFLAQANRNHQSSKYSQISNSTPSDVQTKAYRKERLFGLINYYPGENVLVEPIFSTRGYAIEDNLPNYLSYGVIGTLFLTVFRELVNETKIPDLGPCLQKNMAHCELPEILLQTVFETTLRIDQQMSYAAYDKWVKTHGEEQKLIGVNYTPRQLFWVSATFCHSANNYSRSNELFGDPLYFQRTTCARMSNSFEFAKDFNCPKDSRMNPPEKCPLL